MRIFVTGASGWIGSAVIPELLSAGHEVVGLARSDASAEKVAALGAEVRRGELDDLDGLRAAAAESDGVVHLGYNHDFSRMPERGADRPRGDHRDRRGAGGHRRAAGDRVRHARPGHRAASATEDDEPDPARTRAMANAQAALEFAERGVRPIVARFAPTVHGAGDYGLHRRAGRRSRARQGVSAYVGDGANRWPAVHRLDAGAPGRAGRRSRPGRHGRSTPRRRRASRRARSPRRSAAGSRPVTVDRRRPGRRALRLDRRVLRRRRPASSAQTRALLGWEPQSQG